MSLLRRLANLFRLRAWDADLKEELESHRAMHEQAAIDRGLSPAEARNAAHRAMGNELLMREHSREVWLWPSLESVLGDFSYAARGLRRNPAFAIGVVLTLGLGIGANTSMFSLVDRLLLRAPAFMVDPGTVSRLYV